MSSREEISLSLDNIFCAIKNNDLESAPLYLMDVASAYTLRILSDTNDAIFDGLLKALDLTSAKNNECGWDVFVTLEGLYEKLHEAHQLKLRNFIQERYCEFSQQTLLLEMAEWLGGFADKEALQALENLVERPMNENALYFVRAVFRAFVEALQGEAMNAEPFHQKLSALNKRYEDRCLRELKGP